MSKKINPLCSSILTATQGMSPQEEIEYLNRLMDTGLLTIKEQYDLGIITHEEYTSKYYEEWGSDDPAELRFEDVL